MFPPVRSDFELLKHKRDDPTDENVRQLKSEAEEQLKNYSIDEKFKKTMEKTRLIKIVLVFSGHRLIDMNDVN